VVRAGDQTGVVPTLAAEVPSPIFTIGGRVVGQGVISLRIGDDESWDLYTPLTIDVAISIPDGMAPQRYEVTATTR
jgi:hypothetical protein